MYAFRSTRRFTLLVGCALAAGACAQTFTTLASFDQTNGSTPVGALVQGPDGNFYGTTTAGGAANLGTIFKVTPGGVVTRVHEFNGGDGCFPMAGMIFASDGNFYGTTHGKCTLSPTGTVFKMTSTGTVSAIHTFDATVYTGPVTKLLLASDGYLYGTTEGLSPAGVGAFGTIFKILPTGGSFATIFSFTGFNLGTSSELIQGPDGNFYGTFGGEGAVGGAPINGGAFKITPAGKMTVFLPAVAVSAFHGYDPVAGLTLGSDGNFYGTYAFSVQPTPGQGTVFKMTPTGVLTEQHVFTGAEGSTPKTAVLFANDGNFYGTTSVGGVNGGGTLYRITAGGTLTVLKNFGGDSGTNPQGLIQGSDGALYGVTSGGGSNGMGTVFKMTIAPPPPSQLDFTNALRIAQIADGSSWQTSFQVINLDTSAVTYAIRFWDDGGNPLQLPLANGALSGTLQAGAVAFAQTAGTASDLSEGWAEVASSGRIAVLTIFKQSVPGRPDSEGTVTGTPSGNRIFLPFDNSNGFVTGVAVANTNQTQPLTISLLFQLENGFQGTGTLMLSAREHMAFVLPVNYPPLAGLRGSIEFTASSPDITVVGLRFSPTLSFTSLGQFQ